MNTLKGIPVMRSAMRPSGFEKRSILVVMLMGRCYNEATGELGFRKRFSCDDDILESTKEKGQR